MERLKEITIEKLLSWNPCQDYRDESFLLSLTGGSRSVTPLEVCDLPIQDTDKLWLLLRPEIIPEKQLHLLACDFAEEVLPIFERAYPDDKRPRLAIEAKRKWVAGEITDEELDAARVAARDATVAAAWAAAWAARAAAGAAAWAARAAAMAAAGAARAALAAVAAVAAVRAATNKKFVEIVRGVLTEKEKIK